MNKAKLFNSTLKKNQETSFQIKVEVGKKLRFNFKNIKRYIELLNPRVIQYKFYT